MPIVPYAASVPATRSTIHQDRASRSTRPCVSTGQRAAPYISTASCLAPYTSVQNICYERRRQTAGVGTFFGGVEKVVVARVA
eukprot:2825355-Rhodomonas_salina.1